MNSGAVRGQEAMVHRVLEQAMAHAAAHRDPFPWGQHERAVPHGEVAEPLDVRWVCASHHKQKRLTAEYFLHSRIEVDHRTRTINAVRNDDDLRGRRVWEL